MVGPDLSEVASSEAVSLTMNEISDLNREPHGNEIILVNIATRIVDMIGNLKQLKLKISRDVLTIL